MREHKIVIKQDLSKLLAKKIFLWELARSRLILKNHNSCKVCVGQSMILGDALSNIFPEIVKDMVEFVSSDTSKQK